MYNCCIPSLDSWFQNNKYKSYSTQGKIFELFESIKNLVTNLAMNQSGGIGFANFDDEIAIYLELLEVNFNESNILILRDCMDSFISWINTTYTRYCREPYYLTLNIGLSCLKWGRKVAELLLTILKNAPQSYTRPNIIYKINKKINGEQQAENYYIYQLALECTAKKMIPTYLLTDSTVNEKCDPKELAIMGCRTRVYDNINGKNGSIGRGNIACVSLNLPRVALEEREENKFYNKLDYILSIMIKVLLDRATKACDNGEKYLKFVIDNSLWKTLHVSEMIKQGTLSIGLIVITM